MAGTMFVIGKRDMEADAVSVRVHRKGKSRRLAARRSSPTSRGQSRPEVLRPKGGGFLLQLFFFTFHFQESELVHGVTPYAQLQPITDISMP